MERKMSKEKSKKTAVEDDDLSLKGAVLNGESHLKVVAEKDGFALPLPVRPLMTDVEWPSYVLSFFAKDEMVDGSPNVAGLRRVSELLLGPALSVDTNVVQAPRYEKVSPSDRTKSMVAVPAVVEVSLSILFCKGEFSGNDHTRVVSDVGDSCDLNTDPEYARFATAIAQTRAEARCYRKALRLRKAAADEMTKVMLPVPEFEKKEIEDSQIIFIKSLCEKCGIDARKFFNSGRQTYGRIEDIPYDVAQKMIPVLSGYCNRRDTIPPELKLEAK
jgi:hypothetical protein